MANGQRRPSDASGFTSVKEDLQKESNTHIGLETNKGNTSLVEHQSILHVIFRSWALELVSLSFSVALLGAVVWIFARQNGKPTDDWSFSINLNSLIATISTVYRAVLVAVAATVISQLKWTWFWSKSSPPRSLRHISDFDSASRGIWGALRLIPIVVTHSLPTMLALIVIIFSFATGPFFQQAINTVPRKIPLAEKTASLPVSYSINGSAKETYYRSLSANFLGMYQIRPQVRGLVYAALASPRSNDTSIRASCPTSDCTFPSWSPEETSRDDRITHATIGVCSICTDLTSLVTKVNDSYAELPNGMGIGRYDQDPPKSASLRIKHEDDLSWAGDVIDERTAEKIEWAFANITVLSRRAGPLVPPAVSAAEILSEYVGVSCSLIPCVQAYSASVKDGDFQEALVKMTPMYGDAFNFPDLNTPQLFFNQSRQGMPMPGPQHNLAAIEVTCLADAALNKSAQNQKRQQGTSNNSSTKVQILAPWNAPNYPVQVVPDACVFRMSVWIWTIFSHLWQTEVFAGNCTWNSRGGDAADCDDKWWLSLLWERNNATVESLTTRFSDFANSMTSQFRLGLAREEGSEYLVYGTALATVNYTEITWRWLLFPILLLATEIFAVAWVIIQGLRHRKYETIWKSSILPLVFYHDRFVDSSGERVGEGAIGHATSTRDGSLLEINEMEKVADSVQVRLLGGDERYSSVVEVDSLYDVSIEETEGHQLGNDTLLRRTSIP